MMTVKSPIKPNSRKKRLTAPEVLQMQRLCRERLLTDLLKNNATPGTPIAGERILCQQYDIPISVVRATLAELKNDGIITSMPRAGMRLAATPERPKSLVGARFAMVGYMEVDNPDYKYTRPAIICDGLERLLNEQGGTLQFYNTWSCAGIKSITDEIKAQKINAIIYTKSEHFPPDQELPFLVALGIPIVAVESATQACSSVEFDHTRIGHTVAKYLLELGHRDVCVLGLAEHKWSDIRIASIIEEFRLHGIKSPDIYGLHGQRADAAEVEEVIKEKAGLYSACIAINDDIGALVLDACKRAKISVPENLSVIGVDDLPNKRHYNMTTVQLSDRELGLAAFEFLKETLLRSDNDIVVRHIKIKCPLIVRKTTQAFKQIS